MEKYINVYFEIYGCEMNKSQANSLKLILEKNLIKEVFDYKSADYIILYTCSVRKSAEDKVFRRLNYFKKLRKEKKLKIIIAGCMPEEYQNYFIEENLADFIIGTKNQKDILNYILNDFNFKVNLKEEKLFLNDDFLKIESLKRAIDLDNFEFLPSRCDDQYPFLAYVNIVHGCSNFCSYCIVPYLRGKEVSRKSSEIIEDVKKLAENGIKEIYLLGQNVLFYGKDNNDITFYELLEKISNINGIELISFLSPHPKDFDENLIHTISILPKVSKVVHLPLQSGSDEVLARMNRKYSIKDYLKIVETFYKYNRTINFTSDIIVGFSGETEEDFLKTLDVVKRVRYIDVFTYKYSKRPLVKEIYKDDISEDIKSERLLRLISLVQEISKERRKENLSKTKKAIILKESKKSMDYLLFKTFDGFNGVIRRDGLKPGDILSVNLKSLRGKTFVGERIHVENYN
jgi:tRNA-2-methylthio-N6-dimethylallyladenosine synthase